ncbi:MAG: hypothetical protein AAF724_05315 [Pseudomonadota bacterium]
MEVGDSYLVSAGVSKAPVSDFELPVLFTKVVLQGNDLELEVQLEQHFGQHDHLELTFAVVSRTGDLKLPCETKVNFAGGFGLSYALEAPDHEKGTEGRRGDGTFKLQSYMTFEAEFTNEPAPHLYVVAKLHHRSGIYALISDSETGSNLIGLGLHFDLP